MSIDEEDIKTLKGIAVASSSPLGTLALLDLVHQKHVIDSITQAMGVADMRGLVAVPVTAVAVVPLCAAMWWMYGQSPEDRSLRNNVVKPLSKIIIPVAGFAASIGLSSFFIKSGIYQHIEKSLGDTHAVKDFVVVALSILSSTPFAAAMEYTQKPMRRLFDGVRCVLYSCSKQ